MISISVKGVGKAYKQFHGRWSRLLEWISPTPTIRHSLKWILRDIDFHIQSGEAVGIIGKNGAGKSTLLKMITGTSQPTEGTITVNGRVAALLELGMGFDPDFTGRQNVYMAGQLQGLSVTEISTLFPEIEAFADIGSYIDEPLRTYSSGMQARLAFSVATCVQPDILIVDEALSVGDIAFQAKCMQRMNNLLKNGTTILFVSHALNQIRQFCNRAIYIKDGAIASIGDVSTACDMFQNDLLGISATSNESDVNDKKENSLERDPDLRKHSLGCDTGTHELEFIRFDLMNSHGKLISHCMQDETVEFLAVIKANKDIGEGAAVGLLLADKTGYPLIACNTDYYDKYLPAMNAGELIVVKWKIKFPFSLGEIRVDIGIKPTTFSTEFYDRVFCAKTISATPRVELISKNFGGYIYVNADINIEKTNHSYT